MKPFVHTLSTWAGLSAVMAAVAAPAWAAQSSAYAVWADLTTDGSNHVQLAAQLPTSGVTALGQSYDKPVSATVLSKSVRLLPAVFRGPALTVLAQKVATDATGSNGVDTVHASGTSSVASGAVSLTLFPPLPVKAPVDVALASANASTTTAGILSPFGFSALTVQFTKLKAAANYDQVLPMPARRSGSTSLGKLTLSGPLLGAKALSYSGDILPNTVVVNTPTVKITLNAQAIPQQPVCPPNVMCPMYAVRETVETKAVRIELNNASVSGHIVSGEIVIGNAEAGQ
jgi:hypothetical protein